MKYKENWVETKHRFKCWWNSDKMDRPLLYVVAKLDEPVEALETVIPAANPQAHHLDVIRIASELRNKCKTHIYLAEAFPYMDINIGPGSMATYLGSEPNFTMDTVWYTECINDLSNFGDLKFNPDNYWWKHHLELLTKARELAANDFPVAIPDIIENIDIFSAMRGPQNTCYDLIDDPELVKSHIDRIDELYFKYYDPMYDTVKLEDGSSCYTFFNIWGPGKTAKVQCDFSALMSPSQFREFILPSLNRQCRQLDCSLYHLDGPDAIRHLDALMEIDDLNALQWTPGAGKPDGASEQWYPIYEKVRKAGKSLWISFTDGALDDWIKGAGKIVKTFGGQGMYFQFPTMDEEEARKLIAIAEDNWS
jgi:5-methyltetrahydrofolate--homocysteine methyltransferase